MFAESESEYDREDVCLRVLDKVNDGSAHGSTSMTGNLVDWRSERVTILSLAIIFCLEFHVKHPSWILVADFERGNGVLVLLLPLDGVVVVTIESTWFDESNDVMMLLSDEIERLKGEDDGGDVILLIDETAAEKEM